MGVGAFATPIAGRGVETEAPAVACAGRDVPSVKLLWYPVAETPLLERSAAATCLCLMIFSSKGCSHAIYVDSRYCTGSDVVCNGASGSLLGGRGSGTGALSGLEMPLADKKACHSGQSCGSFRTYTDLSDLSRSKPIHSAHILDSAVPHDQHEEFHHLNP